MDMTDITRPVLVIEMSFLGLLALLWGSSYLFIKVAVAEIPPITLIAMRVVIAAVFLLLVLRWNSENLPRDGRTWRLLLVQSLFNSIGAWTILAWGQQHVDSGLASVLNSTSPIFVFFFTLFVTRHEATSTRKLFGAILGFFGVVLIVGVNSLGGVGQQVLGQLAAVTGAVLYACAAIFGRRFSHLPTTATAAGTMIWACVFLVPASLLFEQPWTLLPSFQAIVATLILGFLCTGVALLIYFRLVKTIGSMGVASQSYLRAGVGVLLGVILLREQVTPIIAFGLASAMFGVAIINLPRRSK
jgi:drug/metabolite transporter (DMT)-like permease